MKINYDADADIIMITLRDGEYAAPNVIMDFDADQNPLSIEILNAKSVLQMGDHLQIDLPVIIAGSEAA